MLDLRTIVAFASLLGGAILLLIGALRVVRRAPVREISTGSRVALIYGSLFIVAGFLLIFRGREIQPIAATPDRPTPTAIQQLRSEPTVDDSTATSIPMEKSGSRDTHVGTHVSTRVVDRIEIDRTDDRAATPLPGKRRQPAPRGKDVQLPPQTSSQPYTIEDRMYLAVSRAFDSVEAWFMKYGSPSPDHEDTHAEFSKIAVEAMNSDLQFPAVAFESGTADLQPLSVEALKNLAEQLNRLPMSVSVEIQARVDSIGPEPFNYLLTKARVEAVCEVLTREGVDTRRLIARALGSQRDDSTKTGEQIQFVVCP